MLSPTDFFLHHFPSLSCAAKLVPAEAFGFNSESWRSFPSIVMVLRGVDFHDLDSTHTHASEPWSEQTHMSPIIAADADTTLQQPITDKASRSWMGRGKREHIPVQSGKRERGFSPRSDLTYRHQARMHIRHETKTISRLALHAPMHNAS